MNDEKKSAALGRALLSGPYLIWMIGFTIIAPEDAKAMVPTASMRKKIEIEFPINDRLSCDYSK